MQDNNSLPWAPEQDQLHICVELYNGGALIESLNLNILQLALLIVCTGFFLFMVFTLPCSISRLKSTSLVGRKLFYAVLWVVVLVNIARLLLSWLGSSDTLEEVLWLLTSVIIFFVEASILVFALSSHIMKGKSLAMRVLAASTGLALIYGVVQVFLVFVFDIKIFDYVKASMWYWIPLNSAKLLIYCTMTLLPWLKCCSEAPTRRGFYVYAVLMLLMHVLHVVGDALVATNIMGVGFCFIDTAVILHYAMYGPVLYFSFLYSFFRRKPRPSFVAEIEYETIQ